MQLIPHPNTAHMHHAHPHTVHTHTHTHHTLYCFEITLPMLQNFQCFTLQSTYFSSPNSPPTCTHWRSNTHPNPPPLPMLHPSQCSTPPNALPLPMIYPSQCSTLPLHAILYPPSNKENEKKKKIRGKWKLKMLHLPNAPPLSYCSPFLLKFLNSYPPFKEPCHGKLCLQVTMWHALLMSGQPQTHSAWLPVKEGISGQ